MFAGFRSRLTAPFAALALTACGGADGASAQQTSFTDPQREEIEELVRNYILQNPEIIRDAIIELQRRAQAEEIEKQRAALAQNSNAVFNNPMDPTAGPEDAPITIVEFFDYNCSYCKLSADWTRSVIKDFGDNVRFVFKEFPILEFRTKTSVEASQAAAAAARQGKYLDMHFALFAAKGQLSSERINTIANEAGVDIARMRADMEDPAITAHFQRTYELGQSMGITGTPFFIVNDRVVAGADLNNLRAILAAELEAAGLD